MVYSAYVIRSQTTGKIYIGQTANLQERLKRHNQELKTKSNSYTRVNKGPWILKYRESFKTRHEAMRRERELKSARGRKFIKKEILGR